MLTNPAIMRTFFILPFFYLGFAMPAFSQGSITGPTCVLSGTEYRYLIGGDKTKDQNVNICVQGGHFVGTDSTCYQGIAISMISITWDDNAVSGRITFNSGQSNCQLDVSKTKNLNGGSIDSLSAFQVISSNLIPTVINCTQAQGGSCIPIYVYQWQWSMNNLSWQDIDKANTQNLNFSSPVNATTYYRRKVSDTVSNSDNYSNIATIIVASTHP